MAFADMGVRATSLVVSAGLLGAAVIAAMTMTITMMRIEPEPTGPVVVMAPEEPPPPPADPIVRTPQEPLSGPAVDSWWTPPLDITQLDGAALEQGSLFAAPTGPALITNPHWRRRPSDLTRYYPRRAAERGVEGEAMLDCLVGTRGQLSCSVISETPANWGFGAAALDISRDHLMEPAMRDGVSVEGRYRMRVPFEMQ